MTREPTRHQTLSLNEQVNELVVWIRTHPVRGVLTLLLAGGAIATLLDPPLEATPNVLASGDCLYTPAAAGTRAGTDPRHVGEPASVEAVIVGGRAERAACGTSHSHEVSVIVAVAGHTAPVTTTLPPGAAGPGQAPIVGTRAELRPRVEHECSAEFEEYIRHPLAGSQYETFAVLPTDEQLAAGVSTALCLVVRVDRQWMDGLARGSGR